MQLGNLSRYPLATLPTPLDEAPRLSKELGIRVLVKRDDLTGFALGGNKVRKLEFFLGDALNQGAEILVTGGGPQSNHARTTAAAARRAGLEALLVLVGAPPQEINGNLLLDKLLAAEIRFVQLPSQDFDANDRAIAQAAQELQAQGRKPYAIPVGGSVPLGCVAYLLAAGELLDQLKAANVKADYVFVTNGSAGTQAGILAGMKYYGATIPVYGISVSRASAPCAERVSKLVQETAEFIGVPLALAPGDVIVNDQFIGPGYGIVTPEARNAICLVAQTEGIFLDPVYTGKTMAGLIALARQGDIPHGATVVFWHTGGQPGMFGYAGEF
ncbi:MAG: D-cysteine desulfhydrase family protein [Anaerolineae bacterium]